MDVLDLTNMSSDDQEPSTSDAAKNQLQAAIASVPEARLRVIVAKLVQSIPAMESAMIKELVTVKRKEKKRKVVPRWEKCAKCKEEFDMAEKRDSKECSYHPGE
jgi:hypothetical protein